MTLAEMAARLRVVNPVMKREMVQRMRAPWTSWLVFVYVGLLGGVTLFYLYLASRSSVGTGFSTRMGLMVFTFLTTLQIYLLALLTPAVAGGAVAEERTRSTFDLLMVSGMGPVGIMLGKLGAAVAFQLLLIVAGAPLYSTMFLFGGIGWKDLAICFGILLSAGITIAALSIAVSTLFRREAAAVVTTYACCLLLLGAPLLYDLVPEAPAYTRQGRIQRRMGPWIQALSPARVLSHTLGQEGGGLSSMGLLARASGAAKVSTVQGGWRGTPMQITLSDGTTVILTQNTGLPTSPDPKMLGRPLWQVHVAMMQIGSVLFVLLGLAAITRLPRRLPLLLQRRERRATA